MQLTKIQYNSEYLNKEIVNNCFQVNKHLFVDKQITGNGFTTGFLNIAPSKKYQSNIIIVPNRQVIKSKQESYLKDNNINKVKIGFIYGDESSDRINFSHFDVMMFVVDSFINYIEIIKKNEDLIDKILIDEAHSFLIQAGYRRNLVGFLKLITDKFSEKAIVSVTATPMLSQIPDIKIISSNILQRDIFISQNQESTLERIKIDLADGKKVIIALQDARILKRLTDSKNKLNANIKVGTTMFQKILENVVLNYDTDSNLTVISSAGFEGFDINNGMNNIYIFEDRAFDYQTFFSQNIVQIIGRSRKGTDYIEWSRIPHSERTTLLSKEDMIKKANSKKISFEKKMTDKNYSFIPKFFDADFDDNFGLITDLKMNEDKYNLEKELNDADLKGMRIYNDFFTDRGFNVKYLDNGTKRLKLKAPSHKKCFETVKLNKAVLERFNLFNDVRLDLHPKLKTTDYIKAYEVYFRRKYWYADKLPFEMVDYEYLHLSKDICNEMRCYHILKNPKQINLATSYLIKETVNKKQKEIYRKSVEYNTWELNFKKNIQDRYIRLLMAISQPKIRVPKKVRNSRDYNMLTEISLDIIQEVSLDLFNKICTEVDIVTCNPRVIYALCGLDLPCNFYGINKVNKRGINTILNKISKEHPQNYGFDVEKYKSNKIQELRKYGFDERVIKFLFTDFWNKPKDSLFNACAYHEKQIINKLTAELITANVNSENRIDYIRRHDSIIVFGNDKNIKNTTDNFEYLGMKNWF
jgi:hypothetical protein